MDHVSEVYLVMAAVWRSYSRLVEKFPWSSTILQVVVGVEGLVGVVVGVEGLVMVVVGVFSIMALLHPRRGCCAPQGTPLPSWPWRGGGCRCGSCWWLWWSWS